MPRRDGTGSLGMGPFGRGLGPCGRGDFPYRPRVGARYGFGRRYGALYGFPYDYPVDKEREVAFLEEEKAILKKRLEHLNKLIEERKKEAE